MKPRGVPKEPGEKYGTATVLRSEKAQHQAASYTLGAKVGHATVIAVTQPKGMSGKRRDAAEGPWGRVVSASEGRVVMAFSLPHRDLSPNGPKGRWRAKGKATKESRAVACDTASEAMERGGVTGTPWEKAKASQTFWWPNLIRRDVRNAEGACKALLDGIVEAGLLRDDSGDVLSHGETVFDIDRANPRLEVTLERVA